MLLDHRISVQQYKEGVILQACILFGIVALQGGLYVCVVWPIERGLEVISFER